MRVTLYVLLSLVALTATISGLLLITEPNGSYLNISPEILSGTPFKDFFLPGLMLVLIIGGTSITAILYPAKNNKKSYNWTLIAGVALCALIIGEAIIINIHWLEFVYLVLGSLIILLAFQLKGKWLA
jgi:hypothetical protein